MKKISFVFPVYNEEGNIELLHKTMTKILHKLSDKYETEILYVNDGSKDSSFEILQKIQALDKRVVLINFSRNFGHQYAITAGLDYASGDAVVIMDSDMQDPPEVVLDLIREWEAGYEVVYAQRRTRKDNFFKKVTAYAFYRTLSYLASINIPKDTGDFRLIDRKVVDTLNKFRETNRFMRGMVSYVGYKQKAVLFDRADRHAGATNYPLKKMIRLAFDGITSFSTAPLKLIAQIGYLISLIGFLGILYALFVKIFMPSTVMSGWTLTIISVLFIGGVQLLMLGVLGMYIGRIYTEAQERPLYIISSIHSSKKNAK